MDLDRFHPAVSDWFTKHFPAPTLAQQRAWPSIKERQHTLIAAPTGSGKTLAAFLAAIDDLVVQGVAGGLDDTTHVVYVSPLKALGNDIDRNLQTPLAGIERELQAMGLPAVNIRTLVRSGDTPASQRTAMSKRPPHILVTTPESLYILLTSESGRRMLSTARTLIIDEIHALVGDKRGSHLALSAERLDALAHAPLVRIGLSATQRPIEEVARFLVGSRNLSPDGEPNCRIVDTGHIRERDLAIEVPETALSAVTSGEIWDEVYDRLAQLILAHRTTLVFVNTRRLAERAARHLGEKIGNDFVTSHHGSLAREQRLRAETRLKNGELKALVATASLELGIDIGHIDLVCQLGSTRSIATLLQRIGRAGHQVGGISKGRIFPLTRDELVESAALLDSVRRGELDTLSIPEKPLDILAQQIVASVAAEEWTEDRLFDLVGGAYPFRNLQRAEFDEIVGMLSEGFSTRRGRRGAYLHRDAVNRRLRARRGARLYAITSGGAIPDSSDYRVVLEPSDAVIGSVSEDFAIESLQGDIFQLGNASWRIRRVERGTVRVEDAGGQPPTIPFWFGEAPGRTFELSESVSRLRSEVAERVESEGVAGTALSWLVEEVGVARSAAEQVVDYLAAAKASLGVMPTQETLVVERFFDESGSTQVVVHAPFGSRLNRAWGLALRKRFCTKFNFELQAAATEDAIVLSLGPTHSFPLEDVFDYLRAQSVRKILTQALLAAPMWMIRWRWNAMRALAILRNRNGKRVPAQLQRMDAEDLLSAVFPDVLACPENLSGEREIPDHPLVRQTVRDCLEEAMDIVSLEALLRDIAQGDKQLVAKDMVEPSPLAQEILNARPYAFLDDAPLEERRTRAVFQRRWLDPQTASDLGRLDPAAIDRVRQESWPQVETADELHDALLVLGFVTADEGAKSNEDWASYFSQLVADRRASVLVTEPNSEVRLWVAAERLPQFAAIQPLSHTEPPITAPEALTDRIWNADEALVDIMRGRLEGLGPVTAGAIARTLGIDVAQVDAALLALEAEGFVMRGRFSPEVAETEWCARRLLARIHSYTLNRLRQEIEPVSSTDFMRFLLAWQKAAPEKQMAGAESVAAVAEQLEGFEAPAASWELEIFPARVTDYDPNWLDSLCLAGQLVWARIRPPKPGPTRVRGAGPVRTTPIALLRREHLSQWAAMFARPDPSALNLSEETRIVFDYLTEKGASFFAEMVRSAGLLPSQVEAALGELVAAGLVTSDSFTGLRALLTPSNMRTQARRKRQAVYQIALAGRWSLLDRDFALSASAITPEGSKAEMLALILLRRYGVVFKRLLVGEELPLPWREIVKVFYRLEARGEIRGGRFVGGFSGEQFALPEAVGMLRSIRRTNTEAMVSISAADPLNLVGVVTPGNRLPSFTDNRVLFQGGLPIATRESGKQQFLVSLSPASQWEAKTALVRRNIPAQLRSYLRRPAS